MARHITHNNRMRRQATRENASSEAQNREKTFRIVFIDPRGARKAPHKSYHQAVRLRLGG